MRHGPFRLLLLVGVAVAAGCATGGGGGGGDEYSTFDCTDPSLVASGYGYSYGAYYDLADNPCVAYPARYYFSPTPESARRNVILAEAPRPHTQVVQRPSFSPGQSLNSNYGIVSNDNYSPTSVNPMPVMPTSSSPTTITVAPRSH
jgi:hypothetical protein